MTWPVIAVALAYVCLVLIGTLMIRRFWIGVERTESLEPDARVGAQLKALDLEIKLLGAALAISAAVLGWITTAREATARAEMEAHNRYIENLQATNDESHAVRVAGIYGLEALAEESRAGHWRFIEIVPAVLRQWTYPSLSVPFDPNLPDDSLDSRRSNSTANGYHVQTALYSLSRRDLEWEAPEQLPPRFMPEVLRPSLEFVHDTMSVIIENWLRREPDSQIDLPRYHTTSSLDNTRRRPWIRLRQMNLRYGVLPGVAFPGADLMGLDCSGCDLTEAELNKAVMTGAQLDRATLWEAQLREADLSESSIRRTNLGRADLSGALLYKADLHGSNLWQATLDSALLMLSSLRRVDIATGLSATDANFWKANLTEAILSDASLFRAYWALRLDSVRGRPVDPGAMTRAREQREAARADLSGASFRGACLQDAVLWNADLTDVDFTDAQLTDAVLLEADLTSVKGLTRDQVESAIIDESVMLPPALRDLEVRPLGERIDHIEAVLTRLSERRGEEPIDPLAPHFCPTVDENTTN